MGRIGLVLGAGGPVGHAYHAGVVSALEAAWGWDARDADVVVGTSAGAQVGALLRGGLSPRDVFARVTGDPMTEEGRAIARHYTRPPRVPSPAYPRRYTPASPGYLWRSAVTPWRARPGVMVASLLPPGRVCLRPQAEGLRGLFGELWPARDLWITAVEVASGTSVAFGHPTGPRTDVGTAVACSGAVPSVCAPIQVDDRYYVDGGVASATHLALMLDAAVDTVVVSSPLSSFSAMRWLLRREVSRLRRLGIDVIALEPCRDVRRAMGLNPMKLERSEAVARAARRSALALLRG